MLTSIVLVLAATAFAGPFDDGDAAYRRGDYAAALAILRPLAEQGDASAQNDLAVMSLNGRGLPKNEAEALLWLRLSADQGHAGAQTLLGHAYFHGWGVPRPDYAESSKWFRAAAEQGNAEAQENLGSHCESGIGIPPDTVEALKWSTLALSAYPASAAEELRLATVQRDREAKKMTPDEIAEAERSAREWKPAAFRPLTADLVKDAMMMLQRDDAMAARLLLPLAQRGQVDAQTMLGAMYSAGKGVPKDSKESEEWFRSAARQGDAGAQDALGLALETGHGLPVRAYMWYRLAAASGDRYAAEFVKDRDRLASKLTPAQIATAQAWAQTCKASKFKDCD